MLVVIAILHGECAWLTAHASHGWSSGSKVVNPTGSKKDEPYIHQGTSNNWKGGYQQRLTALL